MDHRNNYLKTMFILLFLVCFSIFSLGQTKRIRPPSEHLLFKCKLLINPATGKTLKKAFIEVNNGRILRIGKFHKLHAEKGVKIIDVSNKYIIPGLIDTHGHLFGGVTKRHTTCDMLPAFYLAAGVTTVRSPGSMEPEGDLGLRYRIDSGRFLGPRYFHSGPYVEGDPVTVRWMNPVKTPEEAKLKIDHWIRLGATSVKIYAAMKGEVLKAAIDHGHAHGVKVIAHIGAVNYKEAINMGIDELFHGIAAMPDIIPEELEKKDYKTKYKWMAELDLSKTDVREIVKMAAEARVVLTPTADIVEPLDYDKNHMEEQKKYYTPDAFAAIEKRMKKPFMPGGEKILEKNKQFIKMAHKAGCILTTGTDHVGFSLLPGYSLWREMEIFAESGLRPMEVLKAATINGAYAIGWTDLLGTVEPGKLADFVILDANPLSNISNVRKVHRVVKNGIIYNPEKLLKPLVGKFH